MILVKANGRIFFDTDCISAFLCTDKGSIVSELYGSRIVFPQVVIDELSRAPDADLLKRCNDLCDSDKAEIWDIDSSSPALLDYVSMTEGSMGRAVGKGEAAAIALAKLNDGVVASNNLRDVEEYILLFGLDHTTTAGILVDAYYDGLVDEAEGNAIWSGMLAHGCMLGAASFTEYLNKKPKEPLRR